MVLRDLRPGSFRERVLDAQESGGEDEALAILAAHHRATGDLSDVRMSAVRQADAGAVMDGLADGLLWIPPFDAVAMPEHFTWSEDPYGDPSWLQRFHSLFWLEQWLRTAGESGDTATVSRL